MKTVIIAGNIGQSAELRRTQDGTPVAGFSVGVSEGRDSPTDWFDCSIWGKRGEKLCQYLTKGSKVTVSGELSFEEYNGKMKYKVRVNDVALQGRGQSDGQQSSYQEPPAQGVDDSAIPF